MSIFGDHVCEHVECRRKRIRCMLVAAMATVLYIEASPLKQRSHTIEVAHAFLDAYREARPEDTIETIDLWAHALPPFDGATIEAKFAVLRRNDFTALQQEKWSAVQAVARRFNAADKYVFSVPMWNFGVPYVLKHYIDVVTLAGENWTWTRADGYRALLSGKRATLIYSSAGAYELTLPAHAADFQKPYLRHWLSFIGVHSIDEINVAPTLADPAVVAQVKREAHARARELARNF
jgi:FMN-dependent NADH-azoreductase